MEIMKKLQLLLVSIAMLSMFSCSDDDDDTLGVWYRRSDFDGRAREDAAGFVIDNRGYLCGGYRGKDQRERDCWEYNIDNDWWTQCADLPEEAAARNGAPIVTTRTAGTDELLPGDDYAVFLANAAPETIRAGLETLLADPAAARTRAENTRQNLCSHFTWQAVFATMMEAVTSAKRS